MHAPSTQEERNPCILLNAVHPDLETLYEPQKILADHLSLPIEQIHESILEISCFTEAQTRDRLCESTERIEQDLLSLERDYGATLQTLAKSHRIILLIEGSTCVQHIEFAMSLSLFIAAMSGSWPDILSISFRQENPGEMHIMEDIRLRDLLTRYSNVETRMLVYPWQQPKLSETTVSQPEEEVLS